MMPSSFIYAFVATLAFEVATAIMIGSGHTGSSSIVVAWIALALAAVTALIALAKDLRGGLVMVCLPAICVFLLGLNYF